MTQSNVPGDGGASVGATSAPEKSGAMSDAEALQLAKETFVRLGPAGILAVVAAVLPAAGSIVILWYVVPVAQWLLSFGANAIPLFIGIFALTAGLALLNTQSQAIVAGWAFKFADGLTAMLCGLFLASIIGYVIARRASGERAMQVIAEHPKWAAVHRALVGRGFWWTLMVVSLVRLPPSSPFALCNLVLAATRVPWHTYLLGTMIGAAPRTAFVVYMAAASYEFKENSYIFYGGIAFTIVVLLILGVIGNHAVNRVTGGSGAAAK